MHGGTKSADSYSRDHEITIAGKAPIPGSAAAAYRGDDTRLNPEDLLMASLSACHFLSYLFVCARAGIEVVDYQDAAEGTMQLKDGATRFTEVVLHPRVVVAAGTDLSKAQALHEKAHHGCFIASSVNFPVRYEPIITERA